MKQLAVVLLVLIVIVGAALYLKAWNEDVWVCESSGWVKHGNPSDPMPIGGCGAVNENTNNGNDEPPQTGVPFSDSGNLVRGEINGWEFVYEEPGAPALRVALQFTMQSVCDFGEGHGEEQCINARRTIGNVGDRVKIEGTRIDNVVTVLKMTAVKS